MLNAFSASAVRGSLLLGTLFASFLVCPRSTSRAVAEATRFPNPLISVAGDDLGVQNAVRVLDFAISPDNLRVAVAFEVSEGKEKLGVWFGEWEITTKRLIAKKHLDTPIPADIAFFGLDHETMKYTPAGSAIVAQTGSELCSYESATFVVRYCVSRQESSESSPLEAYQRRFAMSADGRYLAVLIGQSEYPVNKAGSIILYEGKDGKEVARWPLPTQPTTLALSPDGTGILAWIIHDFASKKRKGALKD